MDTEKNGARKVDTLSPRVSPSRAPILSCAHYFQVPATYAGYYYLNLHETIRNDNFQRNTALQFCNYSKQRRNNVVMLSCAKNRRYESFRVTSP